MTVQEAKKELHVIKEIQKDIESVEGELEKYRSMATKMTTDFDKISVQTSAKNRLEEAVIKIEEYTNRLSCLLVEMLDYKQKCLSVVEQIEPQSLRRVLIIYYFANETLERTAEIVGHSYQWTYDIFTSALKEYCRLHDRNR